MDFLKNVLEDDYENFVSKVESYNNDNAQNPIKLVNLSEGGYVSKDKYLSLEKNANLYRSEIERLGKMSAKNSEMAKEIDEIKAQYETEVKSLKDQLDKNNFDNAVELALLKSNAKNATAVKALIDLSGVSFEDGVLIGLNEQIEKVKSENAYLFNRPSSSSGMRQGDTFSGIDTFIASAKKYAGMEI